MQEKTLKSDPIFHFISFCESVNRCTRNNVVKTHNMKSASAFDEIALLLEPCTESK